MKRCRILGFAPSRFNGSAIYVALQWFNILIFVGWRLIRTQTAFGSIVPELVRRSATATPEAEGSGRRKAVRTVTPKARAVLERDELGVGKSPARRLFVDADAEGSARVG